MERVTNYIGSLLAFISQSSSKNQKHDYQKTISCKSPSAHDKMGN